MNYLKTLQLVELDEVNFESNDRFLYLSPTSYEYLAGFDGKVYVDGSYTLFLLKRCGYIRDSLNKSHFDFSGCASKVIQSAVDNRVKINFFGGSDKDISNFQRILFSKYPDIDANFEHGYHEDSFYIEEYNSRINEIFCLSMGGGKQERIIIRFKKNQNTAIATGGFISQVAQSESINYYPVWAVRFNLRWLFRSFQDSRILKRLLVEYPKFTYKLITGV